MMKFRHSQAVSVSAAPFVPAGEAWALRVVANGGAMPGGGSIAAMNDLSIALNAAGIWGLYDTLNLFAPDSLVAALTPLISGGLDPYANTGAFVLADLSVNGLQGNGVNWLDTGYNAPGATLKGITAYRVGASGLASFLGGVHDPIGAGTPTLWLGSQFAGNFNCSDTAFNELIAADPVAGGYISVDRTGANLANLYFANSFTPHASLAASVLAEPGMPAGNNYCMAVLNTGLGLPGGITSDLVSAFAIHDGFTAAQSLAQYNAFQAYRTAIGGGFV